MDWARVQMRLGSLVCSLATIFVSSSFGLGLGIRVSSFSVERVFNLRLVLACWAREMDASHGLALAFAFVLKGIANWLECDRMGSIFLSALFFLSL